MVALRYRFRAGLGYSELHAFSRKFTGSTQLLILKEYGVAGINSVSRARQWPQMALVFIYAGTA